MNEESRPGMRHVARVALVQLALLGFCWLALGILNARDTWLLAPSAAERAAWLFRVPLPLLGLAGAVLLPAFLAWRLVRDASIPGLLDSDFVAQALRFPANTALAGLVTSVAAFNVAAFSLRRSLAIPAIEGAKISSLGLLTGTLLAVLSYFAMLPVARTLVAEAVERGALPPERPSFPIRKKVLACSLALAAIMAGIFGLEALTWSQRWIEERALAAGRTFVRNLGSEIRTHPPQSRAAWVQLLSSRPLPQGSVVFAEGPGGNLIATLPERVAGIEGFLLSTKFFDQPSETDDAFVTRWGDVRVVARTSEPGLARVGVILRPDPSALRAVLHTFVVVGIEALAAALLLAWAAGRAITDPIESLSRQLESFARNPAGTAMTPVTTDDEVAGLSAAFRSLEGAVKSAQDRVAELSRRTERETLVEQIAHEVRNPLFGIQSTLTALELHLGDAAPREYMAVLRTEITRLSRLVDQLAEGRAAAGASVAELLPEIERLVLARVPGHPFRLERSGHGDLVIPLPREKVLVLLADLVEALASTPGSPTGIRVTMEQRSAEGSLSLGSPRPLGGAAEPLLSRCRAALAAVNGSLTVTEAPDGTLVELRIPVPPAPLKS